jgi:nitrate reductase NapE component
LRWISKWHSLYFILKEVSLMNVNKKISLLVIAFGIFILLETAFILGLEVKNGFAFGFDFIFNRGTVYRQQFVTYSLILWSIIGVLFMHMGYNLYKE